ncbi:thioredoxin-like protein [Tribonema minus]|uniref:Thioredoxin-like protein n=1 Tax=Tribonema minus TaxID=303371 RepID=A0A835YZS1_9STRA|nr:thioredoxin-like protein [Tribonema minus]
MVKSCGTTEELKSAIDGAGGKLVVIDFFATWCGPCRQIAPLMEQWSNEMTDVVYLKVDVDINKDAAEDYGIEAMPTFKFIKNGEVIEEFVGANPSGLKAKIEALRK